jgi:hypothetical protein
VYLLKSIRKEEDFDGILQKLVPIYDKEEMHLQIKDI